ncbi:MAG: hypothetical protein QM503_02265 [Bacteroidota bacterium]
MNCIFYIYAIITIPIGIAVIYYLLKRKEINQLMKRENPNFTGHPNNTIDLFRIVRTVNSSQTISSSEKKFLIKILLFVGISWLVAIIWIIFIVFFQNSV